MDDVDRIINQLKQQHKKLSDSVLEAVSKEIERNAKRNFRQEIENISGDNPYVDVTRTISNGEATIECGGEQVLFAEFGAGTNNLYYMNGLGLDMLSTRSFQYIDGEPTEIAPRPEGIVPLGEYGKKHGRDDFWFRPTYNQRTGSKEALKIKRNGDIDTRYVWTKGTRPIRALWRARNVAIKKLIEGRLDIK